MAYTILAGLIIAVALLTVLFASRLLFKGRWVMGLVARYGRDVAAAGLCSFGFRRYRLLHL